MKNSVDTDQLITGSVLDKISITSYILICYFDFLMQCIPISVVKWVQVLKKEKRDAFNKINAFIR